MKNISVVSDAQVFGAEAEAKQIESANNFNIKLSMREKLSYAVGDTACNIVFGLTTTLLTLFYTDYMGINPAR